MVNPKAKLLVGFLFYGISILLGSFNTWIKFQTIQLSLSIVFVFKLLNIKTVLFQAIQFGISTQFSSIWPIDRTLSGATTLGQSEPGRNGNDGVLRIPQSPSITGASSSDCLVSYPGHSLVGSYLSAEKQSVYSTAPANWATKLF